MSGGSGARIDGPRLLARLDALAAAAPSVGGAGVTRLAWSPEDLAARTLVADWMAEAGVATRTDAVGNVIADWPGTDPDAAPLASGSHLDTVVEGGPLDGAYGTVAAFEVLAALAGAGEHLRHPYRAVAWANEEGVVAPPFTGSLAAAGGPVDVGAAGPDGMTLSDRIAAGGGDPGAVASARWGPIAGYLELHIEQGPVLDGAGVPVGVVTGITGLRRGTVTVDGRANHAGTTPMHLRADALQAAVPLVAAIDRLATDGPVEVATVGSLVTSPGNTNVVPGRVTFTYDLRSLDDARADEALALLTSAVEGIDARDGLQARVRPLAASAGVATDPRLQAAVADAAGALHLRCMPLPSGAGHDAQHVAAIGPVGMIFVPSTGGLSHHADEATPPARLVDGARVLLGALRLADATLP